MSDDQISAAARDLINRHLATMDHVQVLLHLRHVPEGASPDELTRSLRLDHKAVKRAVDDLTAGGVLERESQTGRHQWVSRSAATVNVVQELEVLYNTRPVTLVRLLYDRPPAALRSFSDAFRLRDPEGGE